MDEPAAHKLAREARFDLLKVIGSAGVVLLHASMYAAGKPGPGTIARLGATLGYALGRNMESIFIMVAGALLLARASENAPWAFVRQRWARLVPATLFWTAFYLAWRRFGGEALNGSGMLGDIARGMPYFHLWFLYAMLGLYALMPGARLMVRDAQAARAQYFTAGALAVASVLSTAALVILGYEREPFFAYIPKLLVYLVAGYLIYRDQPRPPLARLLLLGVACVGGEMLVMRLLQPSALTLATQALTQTVLALCALGWTVTVFLLVMRLPMGQRLKRLAGGLAPFMLVS